MARDGKHANGDKPNKHRKSRNAVLNLTIDGSSPNQEVREIKSNPNPTYLTPCTINGLVAGASGGMLGYAFGFREFVRQGVGNEFGVEF